MCKLQEMKEWFESWFDTDFYHMLYEHRDNTEAEHFIRNLVRELPIPSDVELLDLACGRGRHSIYLDSLGFKTTGVDLSPKNIEAAKKYESESLQFFVHDMRDALPDHEFDIVLNLFTSYGYFNHAGNLKVLQSIYSYLKPGGKLVIDYLNEKLIPRDHESRFVQSAGGIDFHIHKQVKGNQVVKTIQFETAEGKQQYEEQVTLLSLEEFEQLFDQTNFEIETIYGDYDLNPFQTNSDRLIIVAYKE